MELVVQMTALDCYVSCTVAPAPVAELGRWSAAIRYVDETNNLHHKQPLDTANNNTHPYMRFHLFFSLLLRARKEIHRN